MTTRTGSESNRQRSLCRWWVGGVLLLMLLLTGAGSTMQAGPNAPSDIPFAALANDQLDPQIVHNPQSAEYFLVWENEQSGADHDIYARRISEQGIPLGEPFPIASSTAMETDPAVAYNANDNEYLVLFRRIDATENSNLYARRVTAAGALTGGLIQVAVTVVDEIDPAVDFNWVESAYLVVWASIGIEGRTVDGQLINANGELTGSRTVIGTIKTSAGGEPVDAPVSVAYGRHLNQFLVAWHRYVPTEDGGEFDIYARRTDPFGAPLGDPIPISTWQYDQVRPQLAFNLETHEYFIVWEDHHWGWGEYSDIYGQRVSYDGTVLGSHIGVGWEGSGKRYRPQVVYKLPANEFLVAYEYEETTGLPDIYTRRVDWAGALMGDEVVVAGGGPRESSPAVAADYAETYVIVWEDGRNAEAQALDLYANGTTADFFSGAVFAGQMGDLTQPIHDVAVELYCSNNINQLGEFLTSRRTLADGGYRMVAYRPCEFYNIVEHDPDDYVSVAAQSPDGTIVNANQIRYTVPIAGQLLSNNNFWDIPAEPEDPTPPGNWANFTPESWVISHDVVASIQVEDTQSGLAVSTAEYAFSRDGATWSEWLAASCSGSDGDVTPQIISTLPIPFGRDSGPGGLNQVKFRIADMQRNPGYSNVHTVAIDTVPPENPTSLTSTSHSVQVWDNRPLVSMQWSASNDGGSGLAGYSFEWSTVDHTTPNAIVDTTETMLSEQLWRDHDNWYFHLRAVDVAGNATSAQHVGPYYLDTVDPICAVEPLAPLQEQSSFWVAWESAFTGGSPVTVFDIRVVDTYQGQSNTQTWQSGTAETEVIYNGVRGHTYSFFCRVHDAAGNISAYDDSPDATTTVGKELTVIVTDEQGNLVRGAEIHRNDNLMGTTDQNGRLQVPALLHGDRLRARWQVYEHPAVKGHHTLDGAGNWAWRVYLTNIDFDAAGNLQEWSVTDFSQPQRLTVRRDQALIGMHVLVTVEWDASAAYLADLEQGVRNASTYLYDVTDGQMFWEVVEVFDNNVYRNDSDLRIRTDNVSWPSASLNGIQDGADYGMFFGRHFNGGNANSGQWRDAIGFRTFMHEFGHYGLDLDDEYLDRNGKNDTGAACATNFVHGSDLAGQASIMYKQTNASELCSNVDPNHKHSTGTLHDATRGETTWARVQRRYQDNASPARWLLLSPEDRGGIMAGPDHLPVDGWVNVPIIDAETGVCEPQTITMVDQIGGIPIAQGKVWLARQCQNCPALKQGVTDAGGQIAIYGAHDGDTVFASGSTGITKTPLFGQGEINCSPAVAAGARSTVRIAAASFVVDASILPAGENVVTVQVEASVPLAGPPSAELWQVGAEDPILVELVKDALSGVYVGAAHLDSERARHGHVALVSTSGDGQTMPTWHEFDMEVVEAEEFNPHIFSADGRFRLILPAGALSTDVTLAIQAGDLGGPLPAGLARLGATYQVATAPIQTDLLKPAHVRMQFDSSQIDDTTLDHAAIHRWDEGGWTALSSTLDRSFHAITADSDRLGIFAILYGEVSQQQLYLPVIASP